MSDFLSLVDEPDADRSVGLATIPLEYLRQSPYDKNWRKAIKIPPKRIALINEKGRLIQDHEHIFDKNEKTAKR